MPEPLYLVPGRADWESWMTYVLRELEHYVRCRQCPKVGWRNKAGTILWYGKKLGLEVTADAVRWKHVVIRSV